MKIYIHQAPKEKMEASASNRARAVMAISGFDPGTELGISARSVFRDLGLRLQLLLQLDQLRVTVVPPVQVFSVLLIDRDREPDPVLDVAQFDKTVFPIIQVDSIILGNAIRFIEAIFNVE